MLKTNLERIGMISVEGQIAHPEYPGNGYMGADGMTRIMPGTGGITYNARIGDPCCGWSADHLEPCVTTKNYDRGRSGAYTNFACIGNRAIVISGEAKGTEGFVTGKHGGVDHVICDFDPQALDKMNIGDRIKVIGWGQGLELTDYPGVICRSLSPQLLEKMNITEKDGKLYIGVRRIVPGKLMGAGVGSTGTGNGDYDITLFDRETAAEYGLTDLRFGDLVAIPDSDTRYSRTYMAGAMTIGVVVHSDSFSGGHGPGVTNLMCCIDGTIVPVLDEKANLKTLFIDEK